nr:reverse transcriptase domain-containing protein [Tanacetum cinerariifolium]
MFKTPPPITTPVEKINKNKFCEFHKEVGHNTDECMHLKRQIKELIKAGKLSHVIKELKQDNRKDQPKAANKGKASWKDTAMVILMVQPWKAWSKENSSSPVNGSWNVKVPRPGRNTHIVKQQGYSTRMHDGLRTEGSTITKDGRNELCNLLRHNLDIIAWKLADMTGVLRHIEEHRLKFEKDVLQSDKRKGYHQIKMAKEDEEKTAFITSHGIFYYSNIPFGLKNVEATYQRLVDKAFQKQIGRNMEVYVDDLVIKSSTEQEIMRDIRETFETLKEINMKLNPKKCTFRVEEGMFLGYKGNIKGIKTEDDSLAISMEVEEELPDPWTLFTEGSSCIDGSGDELILTDLEGIEFTYALRFRFDATNNEAEYEALVIGLRITEQIGVKNLKHMWTPS